MIRNTWPRDQYPGVGGGLYTGSGGGASTVIGGGLYTWLGGGLYTGSGGGLYTDSCRNPYRSNIPPWDVFVEYLERLGYHNQTRIFRSYFLK